MSVLDKKRVTLQDVANATGYSVNTISHALKNKPDIAPATREKIQQVVTERVVLSFYQAKRIEN